MYAHYTSSRPWQKSRGHWRKKGKPSSEVALFLRPSIIIIMRVHIHTILTLSVYKVTKVYDYHRKHKTSLEARGPNKKQAEGLDDLVSKPTALLWINHKLV